MGTPNFVTAFTLLLITFLIGSCEAVSGFIKTPMGLGVFIVIAVILVFAAVRIRKVKSRK